MKICYLSVVQGHAEQVGQVFLVHEDEKRTLGRSSTSDFYIRDNLVSGLHCQVECKNGDFLVKDLLARNGVLVEGLPIDEHLLREGDRFRIGKTVVEFSLENGKKGRSGKSIDTSLVSHDEAAQRLSVTQSSPLQSSVPLGQLLSDKNDVQLAKLALVHGLLTHQQIREGLNIQKEMAEVKIRMSLAEIFEEREYLTAAQVKELLREQEYRKVRNKDVLFGRVAAANNLVPKEKVDEALALQQKMFEAGGGAEIPRLGELLVTQGLLTVQDSNRILKGIRETKDVL
ncbi:MAG: FHA domain-containing protein [Planctomycetes bacterium]|nr:FHA domain-containing protein [Planctomycetota bacterium]